MILAPFEELDREDEPYIVFDRSLFLQFLMDLQLQHARCLTMKDIELPGEVRF